LRIAVTGLANPFGRYILLWIAVEVRHALLAMLTPSIVQAIVAHSAGNETGCSEDSLIEVTTNGVIVALTFLTGIRFLSKSGFPWEIVEEIFALFTIHSLGVVGTLTSAMHHAIFVVRLGKCGIQR